MKRKFLVCFLWTRSGKVINLQEWTLYKDTIDLQKGPIYCSLGSSCNCFIFAVTVQIRWTKILKLRKRWIYKRYEDIWKYMFLFVGKLLMEEISYGAKIESVGLLRRALDIKTTSLGNNYMYMWYHQESLLHLFSGCNLYCNLCNNLDFRVWTHTTWVHSFTKALICISHWWFKAYVIEFPSLALQRVCKIFANSICILFWTLKT